MKTPEEYARELDFALAHSGERPDEAMTRKIKQAMADARRAALEEAATKLDERAELLSKPSHPGVMVMRGYARAEAIYCSELVRALLAPATPPRQDSMHEPNKCAACGGGGWVGAPELMSEALPTPAMKPCPDCGTRTIR